VKHLVHAILWNDAVGQAGSLSGLDGRPLEFVAEGLLAAACSLAPAADASPDMRQLLAYARVVNDLFQQVTVLPMRYGCWPNHERELRLLLSRNEAAFQTCLQQVEGCVEMGIRMLPAESGRQGPQSGSIPPSNPLREPSLLVPEPTEAPSANASSAGPLWNSSLTDGGLVDGDGRPGINYLLARQKCYDNKDGQKKGFERAVQRIQTALAGRFVKSVAEQHRTGRGGYWSVYFLVRREAGDAFRAAYGELEGTLPEKLLLTGPWPPYNFVDWRNPGLT
jgi:hypothetical protein